MLGTSHLGRSSDAGVPKKLRDILERIHLVQGGIFCHLCCSAEFGAGFDGPSDSVAVFTGEYSGCDGGVERGGPWQTGPWQTKEIQAKKKQVRLTRKKELVNE